MEAIHLVKQSKEIFRERERDKRNLVFIKLDKQKVVDKTIKEIYKDMYGCSN